MTIDTLETFVIFTYRSFCVFMKDRFIDLSCDIYFVVFCLEYFTEKKLPLSEGYGNVGVPACFLKHIFFWSSLSNVFMVVLTSICD